MNKLSFFWYIQIQTNSIHFGKTTTLNYTERLFFALLHEYFTLCSPKISYPSAAPETRDKYNVCASVVAIFQKNIISPENLTCGARLFSNITFMWQVIGIATTLPTPITNCQLSLKSWALGSKKCVCIIEKRGQRWDVHLGRKKPTVHAIREFQYSSNIQPCMSNKKQINMRVND